MKFYYGLSALIGVGVIAIAQPYIATALTPAQIYEIADRITVLINDSSRKAYASGVIIAKEGNIYYVLTAKHSFLAPSDYEVVTSVDKQRHRIDYDDIINLEGVDLAVLQFESPANYRYADELIRGNLDTIKANPNVYIFGYPANIDGLSQLQRIPGVITSTQPEREGYSLTYDAKTVSGMSGGSVFDSQGRLIGIHGERTNRIGSSEPSPFKKGIPINTFFKGAPAAFSNKGNEKLTKPDYPGAIANFTVALRFDSKFDNAYIGRGRAYLAIKNYSKANEDAEQALKIKESAEAYVLRGDIRIQNNNPKAACEDYKRAININPNIYIPRSIIGRCIGEPPPPPPDDARVVVLNAGSPVFAVAVRPDGKIASGSQDGKIRLWEQTTTNTPRIISAHANEVMALAFSNDGKKLASGSLDRAAKVWKVQTGQEIRPAVREERSQVYSVAFNPNGQNFAIGRTNGAIQICPVEPGICRNIPGTPLGVVNSLAYTPNGQNLASGGANGTINLWNLQGARNLIPPFTGHKLAVTSIALSSYGQGQTLVSSSSDGTIRVWDINSRQLRFPPINVGQSIKIFAVAISPDGRTIASGNNNEIKLWNLSNGQPLGTPLRGHTALVRSLAFITNDRLASGSEDSNIRIWQIK